jgi:hypothetical protein
MKVIQKFLIIGLLTSSTLVSAANLGGKYCIHAMMGTLVMDVQATSNDGKQGMISWFHDSGQCMAGAPRPYHLKDDKVVAAGIDATFDHADTIYINEPSNWSGPWSKATCPQDLQNPC